MRFWTLAALLALAGCSHAPARASRPAPRVVDIEGQSGKPLVAPEPTPKAKVLSKEKDCTWVQAVGRVMVGENDTPHQARAAAVEEARKSAMQDFLGVEVKSRNLDFAEEGFRSDEHLTESVLQTTRRGLILKENVVEAGYKPLPDCESCRYEVTLNACLAEVSDAEKKFRVELDLPRTKLVQGDEAKLQVTATDDCWIYLYDVDPDGTTTQVLPNQYLPEPVHLKAGQTYVYPDDEARRRGLLLVAELPPGRDVSAETIRVVATDKPLPAKLEAPGADGYLGLVRRLHESPMLWTDDAQAFIIFKK